MRLTRLLISIFVITLIAGCGLPKEVKQSVKALPEEFSKVAGTIAAQQVALTNAAKGDEYKTFFVQYAERERWQDNFTKANAKLADAKQVAETKLKEIMGRNKKKEANLAFEQLKRIGVLRKEALDFAHIPSKRMDFLRKAKAEAPKWIETARNEMKQVNTIYAGMLSAVQGAESRHAARKDAIEEKFALFKNTNAAAQEQIKTAESELKASLPDYAKFGDSCTFITRNLKILVDGEKKFKAKIAELDRSYAKTLVDMRAEYYVQVGRVSWEESEMNEWPSEHDFSYKQRPVDAETYEYFSSLPEDDDNGLGSLRSFFGTKFKLEKNVAEGEWNKLKIDIKEQWPNGDNEADYFLADLPAKFFHKYIIIENGVKSETGWVEVNDDTFEKNDENLGMDIIVKPYGSFEEETIKTATPAGMAYVGNPAYGRWQTDPKGGGSFWEFYGKYRLIGDLLGGDRYYRTEYDTWNRDYRGRKPYYGPDDDDKYGSGSRGAQTRYAGSTYAQHGGFKGSDHSVRGAGSAARGGGPGGGGK